MAGIVQIEVGNQLPIMLQMCDGNVSLHPQVLAYNNNDVLLSTIDLVHKAHGLYTPAVVASMPDEVFVSATYIVYTDAGHTIESKVYLRDLDIFERVVPASYKADLSTVTTEINANETKIDTVLIDIAGIPSAVLDEVA